MVLSPFAIWENPMAWLLILIVALLILGHKLPSVARSLGISMNELKRGLKEGKRQSQAEQPMVWLLILIVALMLICISTLSRMR